MLLSKTARVKMGRTNKRFIVALGLNYKEGEYIEIPVEKLWDGCNAKVLIQCDYCNEKGIENIYEANWSKYIENYNKSIIKKDCCKKCRKLKIKESNLSKYGVVSTTQLNSVKEKIGSKNKKYNEDYVREELAKKGYKLVSKYINATTPFQYICQRHIGIGEQTTTFSYFLDNDNCCSECINERKREINRKYTIEDIQNIFRKNDCKLLTKVYNNQNDKLEFICNNHKELGIQTTTMGYIVSKGYICNYCVGEEKNHYGTIHNIEFVKKEFNKYGFEIENTNNYENKDSQLPFICNKHNNKIQYASYSQLKTNKKSICECCKLEKEEEKRQIKEKEVFSKMIERGMISEEGEKFINANTPIKYRCIHHPNIVQEIKMVKFNLGHGCAYCGIENNKGKNHYNWQGGISSLNNHLRGLLRPLVIAYLKKNNYKCFLTGYKGTLEVHHLYNFNKIVNNILDRLGLEVKEDINLYSEIEISNIEKLFLSKHTGKWGVLLHPKLHDLFHKEYGLKDNNEKQFKEFAYRYNNGEFDIVI